MDGFRLGPSDFTYVGSNLRRPECVLTTACGDLYVSDKRGGVTRISPDGSETLYAGRTADADILAANGFALLRDGSFLIAPLVGGGVFRLQRNGQAELVVQEADGRTLACPNFVLLDHEERIWVCCLTQQDRATLMSYPRAAGWLHRAGGPARGADPCRQHRLSERGTDRPEWPLPLYQRNHGGAVAAIPHPPGWNPGRPETIVEFDESNMLDGFTLDSTGGAWMTAIVSNRLWHVGPDGEVQLLIEDSNAEQLARLTEMQRSSTGVMRSFLYEEHGSTLRNISSVAFGGPDLKTAYLGSLMGESILSFRSPVAGIKPAHWDFGPFE
jgi:hypothetical protein